ncbi:hypothetical protein [Nocardia sp. NPDC050435]|uniref:hypothetical protein n=1 Tax=Nocardia sp. NPDC050435 TaxID=3155040 RepID=UPI0033E321AF
MADGYSFQCRMEEGEPVVTIWRTDDPDSAVDYFSERFGLFIQTMLHAQDWMRRSSQQAVVMPPSHGDDTIPLPIISRKPPKGLAG